nr:immunoglobulin heavy chain junction region [Macaca mulatta]
CTTWAAAVDFDHW